MWLIWLALAFFSALLYFRGRRAWSGLVVVFLVTSGFQLIPTAYFVSPMVLGKSYDYAFLAVFLIFFASPASFYSVLRDSLGRLLLGYSAYLFVVLLYSLLIEKHPVLYSIQSMRLFFWPVFYFYFISFRSDELLSLVLKIYPLILIQSVLYCSQYVTGVQLLSVDGAEFNPFLDGGSGYVRYLATPDFLIYYTLLVMATKFRAGRFAFCLLVLSQLLTFARSGVISTVASVGAMYSKLMKPTQWLATFGFLLMVSIGGVLAVPAFSDRFSEGLEDIQGVFASQYDHGGTSFSGTFGYRIAHFMERFEYVLDRPEYWLFGRGFVHEETDAAVNLGFRVGLPNEDTGRAFQVDTGDMAWSIFVIRTGFSGVVVVLGVLVMMLYVTARGRGPYAAIAFGGVVYFLLTSLIGAALINPSAMMQLSLFVALSSKFDKT